MPEGLIAGVPCTAKGGRYEVVKGVDLDDFSAGRIEASVAELVDERDAVKDLGLI